MPIDEVKFDNWTKGINNLANASRLPEGFARDMLNFYPAGGKLALRPGVSSVYSGVNVRGVFSVNGILVCVDGIDFKAIETGTVYAQVPPNGAVCGTVMNDELYLCVGGFRARFSVQQGVRSWGVTMPPHNGVSSGIDPGRTTEHLRRGTRLRRYTVTFVDQDGLESGARPGARLGAAVTPPQPPANHRVRIYATEPDGSLYYLQGEYSSAFSVSLGETNPRGQELRTMFMDAPPRADLLSNINGCLVIASGNFVYHTLPMQPHLVDLEEGVFMYPAPVTSMCGGSSGLYLSADKCYKLEGIGTDQIQQSTVLKYPAVSGTMRTMPDGSAAWATQYGAAFEVPTDRGGTAVAEPTKQTFVPGKSDKGTSGSVEHNGERLFVTSVRPDVDKSPLAAAGFFEAEVVRP